MLIPLIAILTMQGVSAQQAARFDAPGAYVEVPHSTTLATPQFTIEFWLKVSELGDPLVAGGEQTLFDKRDNEGGYNLRLAGDEFPLPVFAFLDDGGVSAWGAVDRNTWSHIAVTQSEDSLKIFVNGLVAGSDSSRYEPKSLSPVRIGEFLGFPGAYLGLRGEMDEIRMWDHPRGSDSLQAYMHRTLFGTEHGLMAYWDFEKRDGQMIPDRSSNANNAEIWGNLRIVASDAPIGYTPLPAPRCLRAFGTSNSIQLAWQHGGSDVSGYNLYRGDSPGFLADRKSLIGSAAGGDSVFVDFNVTPDYNYFYRIRSLDASQNLSQPGVTALGRVLIDRNYITGTYYFPQYDPADSSRDWSGAYVRERFDPPQPPMLGHYNSRDRNVIRQHLGWMEAYGIDFLASSWYGRDSWEDVTLRDHMLTEFDNSPVQFALFYRTDSLWTESGLIFDADTRRRLIDDFKYIAETYFGNANHLRVDGKPVVFISLTRHAQGDHLGAFAAVRAELADKGFDVFLVGDEFRWDVTAPEHMQFLDAISPYLMGTWRYRGEYLGQTEFFADLSRSAGSWEDAAHPWGKYVIPVVSPGRNGRITGSTVVTPRQVLPGARPTSTLEDQIRLMRPFVDPYLRMIMVTTWNDWTLDLQVEPSAVTVPTNRDISPTGTDYTLGFTYEGYGFKHLETIRDLLAPELTVGSDAEYEQSPGQIQLLSSFPNPFSNTATIEYVLPMAGDVKITAFDVLGRQVRVLRNEWAPAGRGAVDFDASTLAAGLYYMRIEANGTTLTSGIVLLH